MEKHQCSSWDRVTDPKTFFPTFTEPEFVNWLLLGTFEEVVHVYHLCLDNDLERHAEITKSTLIHWDEKWMVDARKDIQDVKKSVAKA